LKKYSCRFILIFFSPLSLCCVLVIFKDEIAQAHTHKRREREGDKETDRLVSIGHLNLHFGVIEETNLVFACFASLSHIVSCLAAFGGVAACKKKIMGLNKQQNLKVLKVGCHK
jgi:hypothetical protein